MLRFRRGLAALVAVAACGSPTVPQAGDATGGDGGDELDAGVDAGMGGGSGQGECQGQIVDGGTGWVPLIDMVGCTYRGFAGGLYPNGSSSMPSSHLAEGVSRAKAIVPLDVDGGASTSGKYVLLSIGMSNTTQEFCSRSSNLPCNPWTFMGQAAADTAVNATTLAIVNGAQGGKAAAFWDSPTDPDYDRVRDTKLTPQGLTEKQVVAVWIKVANPSPTNALPSAQADAYTLVRQVGDILRAAKVRYPNLRLAYLSNRIFAGYAVSQLNPEPYAYESGLAMKWVVEAQINQMAGGTADARAGNLSYATVAPWVAWGPYLWADGPTPNSQGLFFTHADLELDGTHPSSSGENKVAALLLSFFKSSPTTKCWFVTQGSCP